MQPFEHSETMGKIAGALIALQAEIRAVEKTGDNKFDGYKYLTEEGMIFALRPLLEKHKIALIKSTPTVESLPDRTTKKGGTEYAVRVIMGAMLLHESGEWIKVFSVGEGQDRADKGVYCALTGASKYLMAKTFGFPTGDDPETNETVGTTEGNSTPQGTQSASGKQSQSTGNGKPPKGCDFYEAMGWYKSKLGDTAFLEVLGTEGFAQSVDVPEQAHGLIRNRMTNAWENNK